MTELLADIATVAIVIGGIIFLLSGGSFKY